MRSLTVTALPAMAQDQLLLQALGFAVGRVADADAVAALGQPADLEKIERGLSSLDAGAPDIARPMAQLRRQRFDRGMGCEDLACARHFGDARGHVDHVAVHIVVLAQHLAVIEPDADVHRRCASRFAAFHRVLHFAGGAQRGLRTRKRTHEFIAYGLDQRAVMRRQPGCHHAEATHHQFARQAVSQGFVQHRAAADIGEQNREAFGLLRHAALW